MLNASKPLAYHISPAISSLMLETKCFLKEKKNLPETKKILILKNNDFTYYNVHAKSCQMLHSLVTNSFSTSSHYSNLSILCRENYMKKKEIVQG